MAEDQSSLTSRTDSPAKIKPGSGEKTGRDQSPGHQATAFPFDNVAPPTISLPKGGGALRGIDETFQVNPATGTASLAIPLRLSPARAGFEPKLSLGYDSGAGNGPFGYGWQLALPTITRRTDKGIPRYQDQEDTDTFVLSGAEELVPSRDDETERDLDGARYRVLRYRPRVEGKFNRIERWLGEEDGDSFWRVISPENVTFVFGRAPESRIADPERPRHIFSWLLCEQRDDKGNVIAYRYAGENAEDVDTGQSHERNRRDPARSANRYLKRVLYGNRTPYRPGEDLASRRDWLFELVLDYGEGHYREHAAADGEQRVEAAAAAPAGGQWPARQDPFSTYRAGFEVRTYRLCRRALMFHHLPEELGVDNYLVGATEFNYDEGPGATYLSAVTHAGFRLESDGRFKRKALPPLSLTYTKVPLQDADGEGAMRLAVREIDDPDSVENLPQGIDNIVYRLVDLDGEGLPGVLTEQAGAWFYKHNLGSGRFGPLKAIAEQPAQTGLTSGRQRLADIDGDGRLGVVELERPTPGFYERTQDEGWSRFTPFPSWPSIDWRDPNLRFIDLTGDGRPDILITEQDALSWHPSRGKEGFGPAMAVPTPLDEESGPRLVFADRTESIHLADMSGDGLADLLRIRNGEVCYWPNFGYGRFGAKITMDRSPWFDTPDQFDQARIRLADIDGSGPADLIYLGTDGIQIYFNQSGNGWKRGQSLPNFPQTDNLSSVYVADLLGGGTACLVWASPLPGEAQRPLRYVDLMGGQKPHLLTHWANNVGSETRIHYAPSTKFYLADKSAGTPWVTKLPFSIHVVERAEMVDLIGRVRFTNRYAYHHGYFDGADREFRGFGRVDQWDTEEFATLNVDGLLSEAANIDEASHVPPVLTKTWFHTGATVDGPHGIDLYRQDYHGAGSSEASGLPPHLVLAEDMTPQDVHGASRALKGAVLRSELYAVDGTAQAGRPYKIVHHSYTVRGIQGPEDGHSGAYLPQLREQIAFECERDETDPRIAHELVLQVDDHGHVLSGVSVGYGRRQPDPELDARDQAIQARTLATLTRHRYTNAVTELDAYRVPKACESLTYSLHQLAAPSDEAGETRLFRLDEVRRLIDMIETGRRELPHADVFASQADDDGVYRRLVKRERILYRRDDLSGALPLGSLESLALPFEVYRFAISAEQLRDIFAERVDDSMMRHGGYVQFDGDRGWWAPSGRIFYGPREDLPSEEEHASAIAHFFQPRLFEDPFGQITRADYDPYDLTVAETVDPVGNRTRATTDYRVLQPSTVTDANGNRATMVFDTLGVIVGVANRGKDGESLGDTLEGLREDLTRTEIDGFFADPAAPAASALLAGAGMRFIYDIDRFQRSGAAPFVAMLQHDHHGHGAGRPPSSRLHVSLTYFDGRSRESQIKTLEEPGPLREGGPVSDQRWLTSAWSVYNNKDKPVRQYEPFFDDVHDYRAYRRAGVSPIIAYDPLLRPLAMLHPDHGWEKVVHGAWRQDRWDVNDTLLDQPQDDSLIGPFVRRLPESDYRPTWRDQRVAGALGATAREAAIASADHARTPATGHFDCLGRPFLAIALNQTRRDGVLQSERHATRTGFDSNGKQLFILDARDNPVMAYGLIPSREDGGLERDSLGRPAILTSGYDHLERILYSFCMDSGERRILPDAAGNPLYTWDRNERVDGGVWGLEDRVVRTTYDALRRPLKRQMQIDGGPWQTLERWEYGESHPEAAARNLRGQLYRHDDSAGRHHNARFDFKGNLAEEEQRLSSNYKSGFVVWNDSASPDSLAAEIYRKFSEYDGLNRVTRLCDWHHDASNVTVHEMSYSLRGLLISQAVTSGATLSEAGPSGGSRTQALALASHDARGQLLEVRRDNGTVTRYSYDPLTFRLIQLRTTAPGHNPAFPTSRAGLRDPLVLQQLHYTYDPSGNVTEIYDEAYEPAFFANQRVEPRKRFRYDSLYRLIEASGRENILPSAAPGQFEAEAAEVTFPVTDQALRTYTQAYLYDPAGNILQIRHTAADGGWTRRSIYAETSNRLLRSWIGGDESAAESYRYDSHGNMLNLANVPADRVIRWDHRDMIEALDLIGGGWAYYSYGADRRRTRKVIERADGSIEDRVYLGDVEVYRRWRGGALIEEIETHHVIAERQRVLIVETVLATDNPRLGTGLLFRYQYGDHIGSAILELDEAARRISYEDYHPFGTSAYRARDRNLRATAKRYRFAGKERDSESGLNYHTARYLVPWLGRWCSADPYGVVDGLNLYAYVSNRPLYATDDSGLFAIVVVVVAAVALVFLVPDIASDDPEAQRSDEEIIGRTLGEAGIMFAGGQAGHLIYAPLRETAGVFLASIVEQAAAGGVIGLGSVAIDDLMRGDLSSLEDYLAAAGWGALLGALFGVVLGAVRTAVGGRGGGGSGRGRGGSGSRGGSAPEGGEGPRSGGSGGGEGGGSGGRTGGGSGSGGSGSGGSASGDAASTGSAIARALSPLEELALRVYQENPILQRLSNLRNLSGLELDLAIEAFIVEFERATGIRVQSVAEGAVQGVRGAGDTGSLNVRPGVYMIEEQVRSNSAALREELVHGIAAYYIERYASQVPPDAAVWVLQGLLEGLVQRGGSL